MALKETIISSLFFHAILFLVIAAVSHYTADFSGGFQKAVLIDLTVDDSQDLPAARINSPEEPPPAMSPPSDDKGTLPDQDVSNPPVESKMIPEPEKKTETIAGPAKIENAEKPLALTEGSTSPQAYYEFVILHRKIFMQKAGASVNGLIGEALKENKRIFYGGTAIVDLKYGTDGKLNEISVDSASPELKAFLEEVGWSAVPLPAAYSLGYFGVRIEFTVLEGYLSFRLNTL